MSEELDSPETPAPSDAVRPSNFRGRGRPPKAESEEMGYMLEEMVMNGLNNAEISRKLGISVTTVANHRRKSKAVQEAKVSEEKLRFAMEQCFVDGLADHIIGEKLGVSIVVVKDHRRRTARNARKDGTNHVVNSEVEESRLQGEIIRLYSQGLTYAAISKEVGLNYKSVRARLLASYATFAERERDAMAGRQLADINMTREKLLDAITLFDFEKSVEENGYVSSRDVEAFSRLVESLNRLMEREAKLFGIDAAQKIDANINIVAPEAIELLARLKAHQGEVSTAIDNIVEGEIVPPSLSMGRTDIEED